MSEHKERKTLEERQQMSDLERLRHSCAHVLATAICRLWPDAQLAGGPAVDNGFYYDVELDHRISTEDFERIEEEMKKVVKENQVFQKEVISRADAMKMAESGELGALGPRSEPSRFKIDLLNDIPEDEEISLYRNGDFTDLCAGPHVGRTGNCKAFKIMSVASAFYKGDKNRPMLQRIYGTCFPNRTLLDEHLERLEEARRRDHRKLGRELGLFCIDESVGQGLILWKPKGALIRRSLQDFITEELDKLGYSQVYTPNIGKLDLYRTSGHFPYYQESQYAPIPERDAMEKLSQEGASCAELFNGLATGTIEGYMLKPMNCPHHIKIYANDAHSYRDLPVRLAEFGTVYRWEQSGELGGMTRVRGFTQDDAHIFCTPDQLAGEIRQCLGIVKTIFGTLGMTDYRVRLSMRDPESDKYVGSPEHWDKAEQALREAAEWLGADYSEEAGEAAFYGPKIDFIVRDAIGRASLSNVVMRRHQLDQELREAVEEKVSDWGISIVSVEVRDLIIPKELQGVMSLEAQAECRKSARITLMEAERDVSEILDEVAQTYNHDEVALALRKLHLTYEGMQDNDSTLVVPSAYSEGFNVKADESKSL